MDHKDDILARKGALRLADECACTVSISVGIHIDNPSDQDIQRLCDNFDKLIESIILKL
jgi:hypothetical protein